MCGHTHCLPTYFIKSVAWEALQTAEIGYCGALRSSLCMRADDDDDI